MTGVATLAVLVVVVIQFLSGVVPLAEMAGFTPFLLQLLALRLSPLLNSGHPPFSNQSSPSPPPLASSRSSSLSLAPHFKTKEPQTIEANIERAATQYLV